MTDRDMSKELDDIRSDLKQLRSDFSAILGSIREEASDRVDDARSSVKDRIEDGMDFIKDNIEGARDYGGKMFDQVRGTVEERPITSVLVAFGVGMFLGKLLDRR
jgi:ElaB/YqjD/DUF883 family membrane-anchored ribosome-binding protein